MRCSPIRAIWKTRPPGMQLMWRWHAIEEVEHKGVAFDTWMAARKDSWRITRWFARVRAMFMATLIFVEFIVRGTALFFEQDKINNVKSWRRLFTFLFGQTGLVPSGDRRIFRVLSAGLPSLACRRPAIGGSVDRELRTNYATA